jgi:polyhydroxyalkanoate synthase subunit PhaC
MIDAARIIHQVHRGMWVAAATPRPPVGTTPHRVVHRHDKLVVRHYPGEPGRTPIVLVPSLINRAYVLDLEPGRSLVGALSSAGHPTYLVDWGTPGPEDADEDVAYVLDALLRRSIDRVCRHAGTPSAHLLGYCMGGTLAAMFAARWRERVASLITLCAPVHFGHAGRFRDLVDPRYFDPQTALDADGLLGVGVMKPAFQLLDPVGGYTKYRGIEAASHKPSRLRRVMVRERWLEENVPLPGAFAVEWIRNAYQQDLLRTGRWHVAGTPVDLTRIAVPTLVITATHDTIAPAASAQHLAELVHKARTVSIDAGHIGIVVGRTGPERLYPLLDRWMRTDEASP